MKNRIIILGITLLTAAGFSSCEKEDPAPVYYNAPASSQISNGRWMVASFEVNGVEHYDFYKPYVFHFKERGIVVANGAGKEITGSWSMKPFDGQQAMQLEFGSQEPFNMLNSSNWKIVSISPTKIEMTGTRGDDGTQSLTLQKI
jgi:hypothetical protein